jgi:hypothetical protein
MPNTEVVILLPRDYELARLFFRLLNTLDAFDLQIKPGLLYSVRGTSYSYLSGGT